MKNKVAVFRKEHFNSAHRLNNPNWSDEKNVEIFGKCNNPNYHGHNYWDNNGPSFILSQIIIVYMHNTNMNPSSSYAHNMHDNSR